MENQQATVYFPLRLPAWLAGDLARAAKVEAKRDGARVNLSATARRAIAEYVRQYAEAGNVTTDPHQAG